MCWLDVGTSAEWSDVDRDLGWTIIMKPVEKCVSNTQVFHARCSPHRQLFGARHVYRRTSGAK